MYQTKQLFSYIIHWRLILFYVILVLETTNLMAAVPTTGSMTKQSTFMNNFFYTFIATN